MNTITEQPLTLTEQAVIALRSFEPMVDMVLSYANLTVAEDGIGKVEECHKAVKRLRIELDNKREELNKGALQYQRAVNETAKTLTAKITVVEEKLKAERDVFDAVKLKEKAAKDAEKREALNNRVRKLGEAGVVVTDLQALAAMSDDDFAWFLATESRKAEDLRAETAKLEALRLDEAARQAEELRIRGEELRKEREAMEADRAEMRRQQEEINKHQAEVRAKAEAEAAELRRVEREAEAERKAEALRLKLEAAKPELEKLEVVLQAIREAAGKAVLEAGEPAWCVELDGALNALADDMRSIVRGCL